MQIIKNQVILMKLEKYKKSYGYGLFAEYFIIFYLRIKGYKILARRYKTHFGEIDIIAKKLDNLVVFEVKARKNKNLLTTEVVSKKQITRIQNAMNVFLSINSEYIDYNILVSIVLFNNIFNFKIFDRAF